ncbi:MAG: hypothetical protein ACQEP7_02990 [bacterium]
MDGESEDRYLVWIDEIKSDEIVLSNGEYRVKFQVLPHQSTGQGLPELFQSATITDKFEIFINDFDSEGKEEN